MKFNKIFIVILLGILLIPCRNVYAKTITVDDVVEEYKNTFHYKTISESNEYDAHFIINKNNKNIVLINKGEELLALDYTDDYIEYSGPVIENVGTTYNWAFMYGMKGLVESIIRLAGYDNTTISLKFNGESNMLQDENKIIQYKGGNSFEYDSDVGYKGILLEYFKISLNESDIKTLVTTNGEKINKYIDSVPTIKLGYITSSSIGINLSMELQDEYDYPSCYIYRSVSYDGEYEKVQETSCNGTGTIIDNDLNANTTYYYKAIVNGGNKYSEIVSATTKSEDIETNNKSDNENTNYNNGETGTTNNPNTGIISITISSIILATIGFIIFFVIKKKNYFKFNL